MQTEDLYYYLNNQLELANAVSHYLVSSGLGIRDFARLVEISEPTMLGLVNNTKKLHSKNVGKIMKYLIDLREKDEARKIREKYEGAAGY